jgi:hypothetical protein
LLQLFQNAFSDYFRYGIRLVSYHLEQFAIFLLARASVKRKLFFTLETPS